MDGGAWQATVHGVTKSLTLLSDFTFTFSSLAKINVTLAVRKKKKKTLKDSLSIKLFSQFFPSYSGTSPAATHLIFTNTLSIR